MMLNDADEGRGLSASLLNALGRVNTRAQPSCNSQFGAAQKPPREKHRDGLLVVTVLFTELGHKVFLLKVRAENNPQGPKNVEKQAVRTYVRARPDESEHAEIERMADPEIWTAEDEAWCSEFSAAKMGPNGS